jgi:hypothetical protein
MTKINTNELNQIQYVDQALMWAVISLRAANHHVDNYQLSDNAAVRAESIDYLEWAVVQDDQGEGQFIFTALFPIRNVNPLLEQQSIIQCVKDYTGFQLPAQLITYPTGGQGLLLPTIPTYVNTLEKLVVWLCQLVEGVNRYIKLINVLIEAGFTATPTRPKPIINITGGVPIISGVGAVAAIIEGVANDNLSPEGIISQYENSSSSYDAVPGWYQDSINLINSGSGNGGGSNNGNSNPNSEPKPVDPGNGNKPNGIDTLPVCKEQDPIVTSYSKDGILTFTNIKP